MFYAPYFDGKYFTPVWFAPGDESAVPPDELRPEMAGGNGGWFRKRRSKQRYEAELIAAIICK